MEPSQDINPKTGRVRTGGTFDTATGGAIPQAPVAPATNIPVSAIESTAPAPLTMPEMQVPQADIGGTRSAGQQILDRETQRAQEAVARTEAPITQSERQIREMFGILSTEEQTRGQLEDQAGVNRFSQDLNKFQESLRNQIAQLDAFDLNNIQQNELARVDASRRDITKRTFGAMTAEENIKNAVARAQIVSETRATIAGIEATRGNLQAATEQVDKALKAIYEPVRMGMQMEMFFLERNDKRFDAAQKELANARMMGMQYELQQIDRAESAVHDVVANGYARPGEIEELISMSDRPQEQRALAQMIANRGAAEERGLRMEQLALSVATSRAQLQKMNQPDSNAMLLQSLFAQGQPTQSFQDFLADRGMANMSLRPDVLAELEEEYNASFATDPAQQQQVLTYLVATGQVSVQQAEFMQSNLNMTTASQKAKQQTTILRGQTVLRDVERALAEVDKAGKVSGFVAEGQRMFGTGPSLAARFSPAFELQQHLESIKSNVSIDQLQAMREASPTGGALGQVPVQQQVFLMQVLGSLSPSLNSNVLKENLNDVYNIYLDVMFGSPDELSNKVRSGQMTATQANSFLQQRKETGFNDYNLPINKSNGRDIGDLVIAPDGSLVRVK